MDSIASSYGIKPQQRKSSMSATATAMSTTTTTTTVRPTMRVHLAYPFPDSSKQSWQYYQANRVSAEAQKAQIFEDIQRKIVNGSAPTPDSLLPPSWVNITGNSVDHQRRYRTKHHRLYSKAKRPRTRKSNTIYIAFFSFLSRNLIWRKKKF